MMQSRRDQPACLGRAPAAELDHRGFPRPAGNHLPGVLAEDRVLGTRQVVLGQRADRFEEPEPTSS